MKTIAVCGIAILIAALAFGQVPLPCSTFETGLNNWTTENAGATVQTGHGGHYADVTDSSGGSNFVAPASYLGNWLQRINNCGELCFDVNIIDDGLTTSLPQSVAFEIKDNLGHRAMFRHTSVVEGTGWHSYCAPIGPLVSGNLPNNGQGTWTMLNGTTNDWTTLIQNVTSLKFVVDFASSGAQTEHFQLDNVCFKANTCAKADFLAVNACAGDQVTFINQSTGATSSQWQIQGGTPNNSTATSPTVVFNSPGTFTVKLCVNGGTTSPLCITKTVIISPKPAVPIVSGPTTTCQNPGPYCVTNPQSGVTYTWSATNGTPAPVTGTCTSIQWSSGSGIVAVTATNAAGCKVTKRFEVLPCNPHNPCCEVPSFKVVSWQVQLVSGNYVFTPVLSTSVPVKRVVVDLISANITYASSACGTPHTYPPGISAALSTVPPTTPPLNPWQPVINSSEAVWSSTTAVPLTNVGFPMNLILPPHGSCNDTIHFCVKYSVTDANCRTCEIVQCYDYTRPWGIDHPTEDSNPN